MQNLNELAKKIHENAKAKDFWDAPRNTGEVFMLIVSELGEALEAHRNGRRVGESLDFDVWGVMVDGHFKQTFERDVKDSFEDEIADVVIRILDWCAYAELTIDIQMYEAIGDFDLGENPNVGEVLLEVTSQICRARIDALDWEKCLNAAVILCCNLADAQGFDLMRHIELKMQYNATRERLHGKKY